MSTILILGALLVVAIAIAIGLAYVPMRLLVATMARNVRQFIERQRDRRRAERGTPDRRRA